MLTQSCYKIYITSSINGELKLDYLRRSSVFIGNPEHISQLLLVVLLLTFNR